MLHRFKYLFLLLLLILWLNNGNEPIEKIFEKPKLKFFTLKSRNIQSVFVPKSVNFKYVSSKKYISSNRIDEELTNLASQNINFSTKTSDIRDLNPWNYNKQKVVNNQNISFLRLFFDNDIFNNTDYYYTNGVRIELVAGFISLAPTSRILPTFNHSDYDYQGFSIVQNIYTPVNPDTKEIQINDHPFSGYLTIGHFRNSINIEKGLRMRSEISFGILGPASLGGVVQSTIHEVNPVGWENQIQNDIVIDYSFKIEKSIFSKKHLEGFVNANARIGTAFNNLGGGVYLRAGYFLPGLQNQLPGILKFGSEKLNIWFFTKANIQFVAYDASLQGGFFNNSNFYVVESSKINRLVFSASAGLAVYHKNMGLELENFYLTPEFDGAYDFRYGRINLIIGLW